MTQFNRADRDQYHTEEIHYVTRCQIDGCPDDIIGDSNGVDRYCFKHQNIDPDM
jgi:hypothetical protein